MTQEKETIIIYLNDDNKIISVYVHFIKVENGLVTFETSQNIISIPLSRILKIKSSITGENKKIIDIKEIEIALSELLNKSSEDEGLKRLRDEVRIYIKNKKLNFEDGVFYE
jgi:hypothetical protein